MSRDWKNIAAAMRLGIPEADLDRIAPILESLEESFRPMVAAIPRDAEPAIVLSERAVSGE